MVKTKQKRAKKPAKQSVKQPATETDSAYLLKIVLYVVLGAVWISFKSPIEAGPLTLHGFPVGLGLGLLLASHDRFQIDRKIAYAILIIMTIITFFLPAAIVI